MGDRGISIVIEWGIASDTVLPVSYAVDAPSDEMVNVLTALTAAISEIPTDIIVGVLAGVTNVVEAVMTPLCAFSC